MLISVDIFHCDKKTNHSPPLDWFSTCHAVLITVELFNGLSEMTRLAELTCKLRLHVSAGMAQKRIKIKNAQHSKNRCKIFIDI